MNLEKMFQNTSSSIPNEVIQIRSVNRKENRYEKQAIENAGYKELSREGTQKDGFLTMWQKPFSPNILMFIEKTDGFFYYGGIVTRKK